MLFIYLSNWLIAKDSWNSTMDKVTDHATFIFTCRYDAYFINIKKMVLEIKVLIMELKAIFIIEYGQRQSIGIQ